MKALLLMFPLLFIHYGLKAQENPWISKKEKNPWITYSTNKSSKKDSIKIANHIDTTIITKLDQNDSTLQIESLDPFKKQEIASPEVTFISPAEQNRLYEKAEFEAMESYNTAGSFSIGFFSGLTLNLLAVPAVTVGSMVTSQSEQKIVDQVLKNETYNKLDQDILEENTRKSIRKKRTGSAILGALTGAIVQISTIIILL